MPSANLNRDLQLKGYDPDIKEIVKALGEIYSRQNLGLNAREVTADTTLATTDSYVESNTTSTNITLTLPLANNWSSRDVFKTPIIFIHNIGPNVTTIATQGSDTYVGVTSVLADEVKALISNGVDTWTVISSSTGSSPYQALPSVFDYMTPVEIAAVEAKTFLTDVSNALAAAFSDGVGYMPPGGYYCGNELPITLGVGDQLRIRGAGSEEVEIRFPSGSNGIILEFSDPVSPPSVEGVTITTLDVGPVLTSAQGLSFYMNPASVALYEWRIGPLMQDVVIRGADPTTHGWEQAVSFVNCWYPSIKDCTFKGYSAAGASQNSYESLAGIYFNKTMAPYIETCNFYHINRGIHENGSGAFCLEAINIDKCEFVGVRYGIDIGSGGPNSMPGMSINDCHFNASYRGISLQNRHQVSIHDCSFYRLNGTTEAWRGIELVTDCQDNRITNCFFGNINTTDTTSARGVKITGDSSGNILANLSSNAWNAAGFMVEIAGTASNNTVLCRSFRNMPDGGSTWDNVTYTGTGTGNWVEDPIATITSFSSGDATPSVGNAKSGYFQTANAGATTITDFDDGYAGQVFTLLINDANTTIQNNGTDIALLPGANYTCGNGDIFVFRNYGSGLWREVHRATSTGNFTNITVSGQYTGAIGTATPSTGKFTTLEATGLTTVNGQIKFPAVKNASADANTLDDYEEGTWTPTIAAASGTFTTVSASGRYTAIGRKVGYTMEISITTNGTAAGYITATLPFTAAQNNMGFGREVVSTGNMVSVTGTASSNSVLIIKYDNTYPGGSGYTIRVSGDFEV
jgi:hypothetical protein